MSGCNYQIYMVYSKTKYKVFISPNPALDLHYLRTEGYEQGVILTPPLSIDKAFFFWKQISDKDERKGKVLEQKTSFIVKLLGLRDKTIEKIIKVKKHKLQRLLTNLGVRAFTPYPITDTFKDRFRENSTDILNLLAGRILLPFEIEKLFSEHKFEVPKDFGHNLQVLWLKGQIEIIPAVEKNDTGYRCNRCGQITKLIPVECGKCNATCIICEECIAMGEARSCTPLIAAEEFAKTLNRKEYQARLDFSLIQAQKDAAQKVTEFYRTSRKSIDKVLEDKENKTKDSCLVWAVCGAGKTEVSFGAIAEALNKGEKVLFAIPRRDVVIELEPRLQRAFPAVKITCLYGGSEGKFQEGQITIATTHQAIRFYRRFALIILDEADAYPYQGSEMLYHFVQRAKHPLGKIVYMTATPSKELLSQLDQGRLETVTISARHHGYPLPEPSFLSAPSLDVTNYKDLKISDEVLRWLHKVVEGDIGQVFAFVPTIKLAETVAEKLRQGLGKEPFCFPMEWIQFSHSKDPLRDEKREQFKEGLFPVFVTTSIMERGITVPRAKVLVLFADYERIFDQGTLVQMAGRSGRLEADPIGEVLFVAKRITPAMKGTLRVIQTMNNEARKKGYLYAE